MQRLSHAVIPVPMPYEGDPGEYYDQFSEASTPRPPIIRLSTITERTERTEESTIGPRLSAYGPRTSMTSTVDYGQPIGACFSAASSPVTLIRGASLFI